MSKAGAPVIRWRSGAILAPFMPSRRLRERWPEPAFSSGRLFGSNITGHASMSHVFRSTPVEARARGMEFGSKHARQIQATIAAYRRLFARATDRPVELEPYGREALAATKRYAPKLVEEMEGMAAGAGIDPALIGAINARTEILAAVGAKSRGECSAVVRVDRGGEGPAAVQTWDWYAE